MYATKVMTPRGSVLKHLLLKKRAINRRQHEIVEVYKCPLRRNANCNCAGDFNGGVEHVTCYAAYVRDIGFVYKQICNVETKPKYLLAYDAVRTRVVEIFSGSCHTINFNYKSRKNVIKYETR